MNHLDALGHMFYGWILMGQFLVACRSRTGWLMRAGGTSGWLVLGVLIEMSSIVVWSAVFVCLDLWGWWRWGKARQRRAA